MRALERLLTAGDCHMAVLLQRRSDGRGFARVAGVAATRSDIRPLEFAAAQLVRDTSRDGDVIGGDGRILSRWIGEPGLLVLVAARRAGAPGFGRRELENIDTNLPWLEDLAAIWQQNQRAAARLEGLRAAFGLRGTGAVLLDSRGSIIEVNDHAHRLLARHAGLVRCGERIAAELPSDASRLSEAVRAVVTAALTGRRIAPQQMSIGRGNGGTPLHVSVMRPYDTAALKIEPGDPAVLLLVVDPLAAAAPVTSVCSLYGLTPAQSRLTRRLVEGDTLAEAATSLGVTGETARTYLKQVFAKTGVKRQANLVRMMLMGQVPAQCSRSYARDARPAAGRSPIQVAQTDRRAPAWLAGPPRIDPGQLVLQLR